jgi:hypothetical protein
MIKRDEERKIPQCPLVKKIPSGVLSNLLSSHSAYILCPFMALSKVGFVIECFG